jgi:hypothetical protein
MNSSHQSICEDRLSKLRSLIAKAFKPERFEIEFEPTISVSITGPKNRTRRVPRIRFAPTEEFMTDLDTDFDQISNQGVMLAKEILKNPPFPNRNFQGEIVLDHGGAGFQERADHS